MKRYLIPIAFILGLACALVAECNAQNSTGGWGGYFYTPTYETVYEAPASYYETPMYSAGSMGGSYARYAPPAQYSYVPYSGNGYGYGSRWGSQPVYVYWVQ